MRFSAGPDSGLQKVKPAPSSKSIAPCPTSFRINKIGRPSWTRVAVLVFVGFEPGVLLFAWEVFSTIATFINVGRTQ